MDTDDARSRQQQIVTEFRRRREREMIAAIPFLAGASVAYTAYRDPTFRIMGVSGMPLLLPALAVVAACCVYHLVNWRCPVCGRVFLTGIFVSSCDRCGTVFQERMKT